ncbi:MAG: CHAD domain-containing protein [Actinobacteria bacterium]|nr:CHAD domain-containing protein [Actinomycetota bacterium]
MHTLRRTAVLRAASGPDGPAGPSPSRSEGPAGARPDLGILTDDVCTVVDGPRPATFREIEIELAPDADDHAVDDLVAALRRSGTGAPDPTPKVVRALGPTATEPSELLVHPVPRPPTVDAVIRHALSDAVAKLVVADPVARLGDDIEGVHQARVATRRLRSHLRTFGPLLDPEWAEGLREEIGWLADELGAVRDADVLRARIEDRVAGLDEEDRAAAAPIVERLVADQAAARTVLLDGMRSPRYLTLLDHLVDAAQRPRVVARVERDDAATLRDLVRRPWNRLRDAVRDLPDVPPDPALHAVRIKAKRARYAAEVMEPAFGRPARDFAKALTRVQDVLGEHQDAVVAGRWLRATALTLGDAGAVYAAGELGAVERAAADASRAAWPKAWTAASRGRLRRWL